MCSESAETDQLKRISPDPGTGLIGSIVFYANGSPMCRTVICTIRVLAGCMQANTIVSATSSGFIILEAATDSAVRP